ncbi:MAG: histidinol-phosphate transaminase [Proteobacteria bacterium]|nr:histidinol-phosphate transaminase [Pseudomonadota bacterium]MBU1583196.1 histidinol-phosphate transaminase [Pseudomonadota bacterium]MBU2453717.1 histidinol-phosphate transaminase [Pseudomonadota bacterium]MBU2631286.1 histidinol-phosphate transaminase [Pseudomonadota bacterium]
MNRFWSPFVNRLEPYVPGEQPADGNLIKLNTNENPYGPSPKVLAAMKDEISNDLRRYPDPEAWALKSVIADTYDISIDQVFVGNGSDEVLAHMFHGLFCQDQPVLFPDISYSFYTVYCGLYQIQYQLVSLNDQFEINIKDYCQPNGGIIIANPNAPTGIAITLEQISALLEYNKKSAVIIDEAYIDFGGRTAVSLIHKYPNLLVVQTLSKSRSLAGLRVGFAVGNKELIEALARVKNSFNSYPLDRLAIAGAMAAIKDTEGFNHTRNKIIQSRQYLTKALSRIGFYVLPSLANFVFASHEKIKAKIIYQVLKDQGILVRYFDQDRIRNFIRITIGTQKECEMLVKSLTDLF